MLPKRKLQNIYETPGWKNAEKITISSKKH